MSDAPLVNPGAAEAILNGTHGDPFAELGLHKRGKAWVVTAFVPGADKLWVLTGKAGKADEAAPVENASGLFALTLDLLRVRLARVLSPRLVALW